MTTSTYPITHYITPPLLTLFPSHPLPLPPPSPLSPFPPSPLPPLPLTDQSLVVARRVAEASSRGLAPALLPFPVNNANTKGDRPPSLRS